MKLSIQTLFPTGNYLNKRYGIEMDFPDDSNPSENFKYLNEIVASIHMAEFPSLYKDGKPLYSNYSGEEPEILPNVTQMQEDDNLDLLRVLSKLESMEYKEEAHQFLIDSGFRYNVEAIKIVNSKPLKK